MKVYTKNNDSGYRHPEDMKKILDYLGEHGILHVSGSTIERLYSDFSESEYCAGWMGVDDDLLEQFSDWLDEIEL